MGHFIGYGVKGFRHRPRLSLLQAAIVALLVGVLVGSIQVGKSLENALMRVDRERLGKVRQTLRWPDRMVSPDWTIGIPGSAAVLVWQGQALVEGRPGIPVQVLGVPSEFFEESFRRVSNHPALSSNEVWWNERAGSVLGIQAGDGLVLQLKSARASDIDGPMSRRKPEWISEAVVARGPTDSGLRDRFDLTRSPSPPLTLFVDRTWLAQRLAGRDGANTLLFQEPITETRLEERSRDAWMPADFGIRIRKAKGGILLEHEGIFFPGTVAEKIRQAFPDAPAIRTTLLKSLAQGERTIPYLIATSETGIPGPMPGSVWVDQGVADRLGISAKTLDLHFWTWAGDRRHRIESNSFHLTGVFAVGDGRFGPEMFPDFPGMTGDSCRDWDPGLPVDLKAITPWHEAHWKGYRGSPRVLLHPDDMVRFGADPRGQPTAFRLPALSEAEVTRVLRSHLALSDLGSRLSDLASIPKGATDYTALFVGVSLFLPVSLFVLLLLVTGLRMEEQAKEISTLRAMGLSPQLAMAKDMLVAIPAMPFGLALGYLLTLGSLKALSLQTDAPWSHLPLRVSFDGWTPLLTTFFAAVTVALVQLVFFRRFRPMVPQGFQMKSRRLRMAWITVGTLSLFTGVGAVFLIWTGQKDLGAFAVGLASCLAGLSLWVRLLSGRLKKQAAGRISGRGQDILLSLAHRPLSALAGPVLLTMGLFFCLSLGVFEGLLTPPMVGPGSATGGFTHHVALVTPWSPPIGSDDPASDGRVVPVRRAAGEDASCLNPLEAGNPTLLGFPLDAMGGRFTFHNSMAGMPAAWEALRDGGEPYLKVAADAAILEWQWRRRIGDLIPWTSPSGKQITLKLVAATAPTVLQGSLFCDERALLRLLPEVRGYQILLGRWDESTAKDWSTRLKAHGAMVETTRDRLLRFARVEITYLRHFQILSALALMVALLGFGLLGWKELEKKSAEHRLLLAVGVSPRRAARHILAPVFLDLLASAILSCTGLAGVLAARGWMGEIPFPSWTVVGPIAAGLLACGAFLAAASRRNGGPRRIAVQD